MKKNKKTNSNILVWVLCLIVIVFVFTLPYLQKFIDSFSTEKVEKTPDIEKKQEKKVVDSETLNDIHFPIMRNSKYNFNTYYSLDSFKISDMRELYV